MIYDDGEVVVIFDWDIWPWRVAEGADELKTYRLERSFRSAMRVLGLVLYPSVRKTKSSVVKFVAKY